MSRSLLERRLVEGSERLKRLRREVQVADEQVEHFAAEADDARLRALVSETPLAERDHREARKHLDAMERHRADLQAEIAQIELDQDTLLDRLAASTAVLPATGAQ